MSVTARLLQSSKIVKQIFRCDINEHMMEKYCEKEDKLETNEVIGLYD